MVVDEFHLVLASIQEETGAEFVNDPCRARAVLVNHANRSLGKDFTFSLGMSNL